MFDTCEMCDTNGIVIIVGCVFSPRQVKQSTAFGAAWNECGKWHQQQPQQKISYFSSIKKIDERNRRTWCVWNTHSIRSFFRTCNFPPKNSATETQELPELTTWITGYFCWNAKLICLESCVSVYLSGVTYTYNSTLGFSRSTITIDAMKRKRIQCMHARYWTMTKNKKPATWKKNWIICVLNAKPRQRIVFSVCFCCRAEQKSNWLFGQYNKSRKWLYWEDL